jgi:hypothetical protein
MSFEDDSVSGEAVGVVAPFFDYVSNIILAHNAFF